MKYFFKYIKLTNAINFCKSLLAEGKYAVEIIPFTEKSNIPPYDTLQYYEVQVTEITKPKITVLNTEDTPEVRKQLNPDAEKLDKDNYIEKK